MKRSVLFKVNNQKLTGTLFFPKNLLPKNPGLLFVHGWESRENGYWPRAKELIKLGFICLTFNLRGHGTSEGKLTKLSRKDHFKDVLAAFDFLASRKEVDPAKIAVCGSSYGGYLASLLSLKRKIEWLVLRAPALYEDKSFNIPTQQIRKKMEDLLRFRQKNLSPKDNFALKALTQYKGKALLLKSENDNIVPSQTIDNYRNALTQALLTFMIIIRWLFLLLYSRSGIFHGPASIEHWLHEYKSGW